MKILKNLLSGLWFSIPAAGLIYLGLIYDKEPGSWILFGVVLILGLPWNIFGFLPILYSIYKLYLYLCSNIGFLQSFYVHPYLLLFLWVAVSGVLGAHINGIISSYLIRKVRTANTNC